MDTNIESLLPSRPEEPLESDCCGSGCSPCVFEIYQKQLLEWKKQCEKIIHCNGTNVKLNDHDKPLLSQLKSSHFQIISIEKHTNDTYFYTFQAVKETSDFTTNDDIEYIPDRRSLNIKVGQHVIMKGKNDDTSNSLISRAYTPISDVNLGNVGCFKILVKLYENGKMSKFFESLRENSITEWRGPYGDYEYLRNSHRFLLMFAAGTGIAPMYPIAKSIVEDDMEETHVRLLYACKDFEDILLRNEIQALTLYWNFSAEIYLSQATLEIMASQSRYSETVHHGRINKAVIKKELSGKKLEQIFVLICGTKPFNKDIINFLKEFGLPENNIHLF